jgi:hypothetical protein
LISIQLSRVSYSGGIDPRHEFYMQGYPPHQLEFLEKKNSVFEKYLEAKLSILRCLKLIRRDISTF